MLTVLSLMHFIQGVFKNWLLPKVRTLVARWERLRWPSLCFVWQCRWGLMGCRYKDIVDGTYSLTLDVGPLVLGSCILGLKSMLNFLIYGFPVRIRQSPEHK